MHVLFGEDDLLHRAMAAYFRRASLHAEVYQPPSIEASYVCRDDSGKIYVLLANQYRPLAVYRLRNQGTLRWLRRWPKEVEHCTDVAT